MVRFCEVDVWSTGNDVWRAAAVVDAFDCIDVDGFRNVWLLIKIARIGPKVFVVGETILIAAKLSVIRQIKPHQGGKQPPVGFGDPIATQIALCC